MSAGTLTLVNGSDVIVGVGTAFKTTIHVGDYIFCKVNGTPYTMPVKSVTTDTDCVVTAAYTGPDATDVPWEFVPQDIMSFISAALGIQSAEAMRQLNNDKDNWLQVYSDTSDNITVRIGNGLTFSGPSWKYITDLLKNMDVDQLQQLADEIHTDVTLNEAIKQAIEASQADVDAKAAQVASDAEQVAADKEQIALDKAAAAQSAADAQQSKEDAAESARQAAASNPALALQKSLNLSDLDDKEDAWLNVRPDGPTSLSAEPVEDMDSATMGWVKKFVASVKSVIQSWSVINADATAPANGTTVKGGALRSAYKVGSTEQAAAELLASLTTSSTGVKAVSAEVVVKDSTSGTTTSKTIKLGTIDGLTGGIISSSTSIGGTTSVVQHNSFVSDGKTYHQGGKTYGYLSDSTSSPGTRYWALWNEYVEGGAGYIQLLFNIGSLQKYWTFYDSGNAAASGTWNSNSDGRLKIRVKRVEDPLVKMRVMQGATWDRLDGAPSGQGFIAQEVEKVFPDAVSVTGDRKLEDGTLITGVKSVDVAGVAAALHHESILKLMDIVKEAITTIAGVTSDESAKAALEAIVEKIPSGDS